ncbi:hypothetical protein BHM03_00038774 [Ensete ventricosum]|uniref:YqgF/RNase H-like domain-containing protein n=1 Tax=Ensete ventricosum TaxID=4639 RepID=A0A445MKD9_ENSVE|nr:hypothetical protein BHM03_00038774 [Ensete ventricosum]
MLFNLLSFSTSFASYCEQLQFWSLSKLIVHFRSLDWCVARAFLSIRLHRLHCVNKEQMKVIEPVELFQKLCSSGAMQKGRLLGLDVGQRYVGLAVSDVANRIASPVRIRIHTFADRVYQHIFGSEYVLHKVFHTARYGRYVSVRWFTGTWTACTGRYELQTL